MLCIWSEEINEKKESRFPAVIGGRENGWQRLWFRGLHCALAAVIAVERPLFACLSRREVAHSALTGWPSHDFKRSALFDAAYAGGIGHADPGVRRFGRAG